MLLDSGHTKWLIGTAAAGSAAVCLYAWLGRDLPAGPTGGSRVGLAYGIAGGGLILFAWLLTALRFVPRWWWIGSRAFWLKGHLWLGLLSGVLILCHSGGRFGGPLEQALYAVFGLTLLTGVVGVGLQQFLPRRLTGGVPVEVPYEQVPEVCDRLRRQADEFLGKVDAAPLLPATAGDLRRWYEELVRPYLGWPARGLLLVEPGKAAETFAQVRALPGVATAARDSDLEKALVRLEGFCAERRALGEQERLHRILHAWLYLHVPLSWAMLVLAVAHVGMTLYY